MASATERLTMTTVNGTEMGMKMTAVTINLLTKHPCAYLVKEGSRMDGTLDFDSYYLGGSF